MADPAQDPENPVDLSWRKRHPVFSRVLLYTLGLGIMLGLLHLYRERQAVDEQDRVEALTQELDGLGLVHLMDKDGSLVLSALEERFGDPDLPMLLRGRVLRWRALALRKRGDAAPVEAALQAASVLDLEPEERLALQLEWAEARIALGNPEAALEILPSPEAASHLEPLLLLRALLHAQAEQHAGRPAVGQAALEASLAGLRAPLDADVRVYVGGREWTAPEMATVSTEVLVTFEGSRPADAWRRLVRLAPRDLEALLAATRAFLSLGKESDARAAWARARSVDPQWAALEAAKDPALAALEG